MSNFDKLHVIKPVINQIKLTHFVQNYFETIVPKKKINYEKRIKKSYIAKQKK
jgi:hypothetical protein